MRPIIVFLLAFGILLPGWAQQKTVLQRIEPPSWWVGMADSSLQLLVYGQNIKDASVAIAYPGVSVRQVHRAESPNYLFIDLALSPETPAGEVPIQFSFPNKKQNFTHLYWLEEKTHRPADIGQADVIYLITPDRFVNANPRNDAVAGMLEAPNRAFDGGRHGGDLEGVRSSLDYLDDLGVTTVWLNPVLENDMKDYSYHGYAATDFYKVDPRFGSNAGYRLLADELHLRKMKIIMDMVFNHCGLEHWWLKDMPFANWIHDYPANMITNYAIASHSDPHAAAVDQQQMERGWFVQSMPDLNHAQPFLTRYLIQNSLWWIEYAGLDGIRMDTYPYNDRNFMAEWARRVEREYPGFYLLGETWIDSEAIVGFWTDKTNGEAAAYDSDTRSMTDFPLAYAIAESFRPGGNVTALYNVLSKDFLYDDPFALEIFMDNHDMDRIFFTVGEDIDRFRQAVTFLLTTRGIPQLYYGTEILMKGSGPHGIIREDFPGGWAGDKRNAFTARGRSDAENIAFNHIQKLLQWRKNSEAIREGKLTHFLPVDNVYVYARRSANESVLVIINNQDVPVQLDMKRYQEVLTGYDQGTDVLRGEFVSQLNELDVRPHEARVLVLGKNGKNTPP